MMKPVQRWRHEDVEGIRVGRFPGRMNTTCIVYRLGDILIDTGPANQWPVVEAFLENHPPELVLLTHHHEDHSGNAARIQRRFGARVLAPEKSLPLLQQGFPLQWYRRVVWGAPEPIVAEALPERLSLPNGLTVEAIPAPGHSPDMTCFRIPRRGWLFTGDLYVTTRPQFLRSDEDPLQEMESLRRVLERDFEVVFCAHRGIVPEGRRALQEKLAYWESLRDRVQTLYRRGKPVSQIRRELLGAEEWMSLLTGGHFSKENLIRALLAEAKPDPATRSVLSG